MVTMTSYWEGDLCNTDYAVEQDAIDCEASHADKGKLEVVDSKYTDFHLFPNRITVEEKKTNTTSDYTKVN